jgi:hypothetical protein
MHPYNIDVTSQLSDLFQEHLVHSYFWHCKGDALAKLQFCQPEEWQRFVDSWDRLVQDKYMQDGGSYRYRRYSALKYIAKDQKLILKPHSFYMQSKYVNKLNGGIKRFFDPVETDMLNNPFLNNLLQWLIQNLEKIRNYKIDWDIRLHPYRILANEKAVGQPTPEELHRDGVDFVMTLMIKRNNIKGGETIITNNDRKIISKMMLQEPMDMLIADDRKTMHEVTAITRENLVMQGHRDVLVVAFTE